MGQKKQPDATGKPSPTPQLDALVQADPDLVDRIFDYAVKLMPDLAKKKMEIKDALRGEFAGERAYIRRHDADLAGKVLEVFNGRNATQTARELRIGRATVYRKLKQAGGRGT
jgi:transcriptional regulator of acetoin/glycerol metabolism